MPTPLSSCKLCPSGRDEVEESFSPSGLWKRCEDKGELGGEGLV